MKKSRKMWAIQHVASGSWEQGDTSLKLYPFEHEARLACVNDAFRPIAVTVSVHDVPAVRPQEEA